MHPELFRIGNFPVRSFGVMLIIGFLLGYWLAVRRAEKFGLKRGQIADLAIWGLLAGVLGARIGWVIQEWGFYSKHLTDIPKLTEGGMTSYGGVIFGIVAIWIWCARAKVRLVDALDLIAAPGLLMVAMGRIGCFLNGCCYGAPCSLPWAVPVHADDGSHYLGHPAQLYDTAMNLIAFGLLLWYEKRTSVRKPGQFAALFFVLYGITRFVYEIFRAGYSSTSSFGFSLTDGQIAAIVMFVFGTAWFVIAGRRARGDMKSSPSDGRVATD